MARQGVDPRNAVNFNLEGMEELQAQINELRSLPKTRASAAKGLREAIKIMKAAAIENAKAIDDTGSRDSIAKNIKTKVIKTRKKTNVRFRLGVDKKREFWALHRQRIEVVAGVKRKKPNPFYGTLQPGATPYWHFVELGTRHSKAKPFLRPALNGSSSKVIAKFKEVFMADVAAKLEKARAKRAASGG